MSFIPNEIILSKHCLTKCISTLHRSFEIHWVRQYLVNVMDLTGTVHTTSNKTEPIVKGIGYGKLSIFNTVYKAA